MLSIYYLFEQIRFFTKNGKPHLTSVGDDGKYDRSVVHQFDSLNSLKRVYYRQPTTDSNTLPSGEIPSNDTPPDNSI